MNITFILFRVWFIFFFVRNYSVIDKVLLNLINLLVLFPGVRGASIHVKFKLVSDSGDRLVAKAAYWPGIKLNRRQALVTWFFIDFFVSVDLKSPDIFCSPSSIMLLSLVVAKKISTVIRLNFSMRKKMSLNVSELRTDKGHFVVFTIHRPSSSFDFRDQLPGNTAASSHRVNG